MPILWLDVELVQQRRKRHTRVRTIRINLPAFSALRLGIVERLKHRPGPVIRRFCVRCSYGRGLKYKPFTRYRGQLLNREDPFHGGAFAACAHNFCADLAAEQCVDGVDNDRLARARLTREHVEQAVQAQVERIDDSEIFDT